MEEGCRGVLHLVVVVIRHELLHVHKLGHVRKRLDVSVMCVCHA